jgi:hypothetical protein
MQEKERKNSSSDSTRVDPACGSGGMLVLASNEVFRERLLLHNTSGRPQVHETTKLLKYSDLAETALLTSRDVMELFGVSRPTFARYRSRENLQAAMRDGRRLFFMKRDLEMWWKVTKAQKGKYLQAIGRATRTRRYDPRIFITSTMGSGKTQVMLVPVLRALLKNQNCDIRSILETVRDSLIEALQER